MLIEFVDRDGYKACVNAYAIRTICQITSDVGGIWYELRYGLSVADVVEIGVEEFQSVLAQLDAMSRRSSVMIPVIPNRLWIRRHQAAIDCVRYLSGGVLAQVRFPDGTCVISSVEVDKLDEHYACLRNCMSI